MNEEDFFGDIVGPWSEIKLEIVSKYAAAYSRILATRTDPAFYHVYIDAFAGGGEHVSRASGERILGSPARALRIEPPFREYHFIDLDGRRVESLRQLADSRDDVYLYEGDCNARLIEDVFPRVRWEDYRRGLCLLDPYGMQLRWEVLKKAGDMGSIEIILNFPIGPINRNVLRVRPEEIDPRQAARMTALWGDNSWLEVAYRASRQGDLFGDGEREKARNEEIEAAFRQRLRDIAGFEHVPAPIPMRNRNRVILYYIFFASHQPVAVNIIESIFNSYRSKGYR